MLRSRCVSVAMLSIALCVAIAAPTQAQYFGRNKVQYEKFDFKTLKTEHFDLYYYPQEEAFARQVARMAERWYDRLSRALEHRLNGRQSLVLYASHPHFEQTNVVSALLSEATGGVTESLRRRIVLPAGASLAETDHVVGHELVHAFQYDIGANAMQRAAMLPLWFVEGMAEYLSLGPDDPHTALWLRDAVLSEQLPAIRDLHDPKYFPYRYGQALFAFLAGRFGDRTVGDSLFASMSGDAIAAVETVTGVAEPDLTAQWHQALRERYAPVSSTTQMPAAIATPVITDERGGGELNVAPALSPDGSRLVFLSERNFVSIDMYLADASTGRIIRKLISTAADPHFDSLQFINSAGSWDAAGRRFAVAAVRRGTPHLAILDAERGRVEREIELEQLGEIYHPTWSPDGRRLVFSAIAGGYTDLYVYDLERSELQPLTRDAYADLQPAWSPDGRTIAFVTDRYTTDLSTLAYRSYRLALLDVATREVRELPVVWPAAPSGRADAKQIVPQWSGDSRSLFFLSDRSDITNIYRLDVSTGAATAVTNIATGVTGITALSPALSVAAGTGRLAFSAFHRGKYEILTMDAAQQVTEVTVPSASPEPALATGASGAAKLPSTALMRTGAAVPELLKNATRGLPPLTETFPTEDYEPRLRLDYIGQPYLVAGADRFGAFAGGGVSFLLSDMLGDRTLAAAAQIQGDFDSFAGQLGYINRRSRWNWGGVVEQIPYITGTFRQTTDTIEGVPVVINQIERFNQIHRQVSAIAAYPLSQSQRLEINGGLRQIGFTRRVDEQIFLRDTGDLLDVRRRDLPAPDGVSLAQASAALVFDTSLMGPTGPILGRRYRFEVEPTFGDLRFTNLLVDFRQYVVPVKPITLAGRLLHFGRYGSQAEDFRLTPLFLGYPQLVRGYSFGSFDNSECVPNETSECPAFDRLIGSRLLVANAEIRFPLLGLFKREFVYGQLPIEGVIFGDAGVAWTRGEDPEFAGGTRDVVRSVGAGVRINALGFAVVELDAVRPLDRPGRGWTFAFNFIPGF